MNGGRTINAIETEETGSADTQAQPAATEYRAPELPADESAAVGRDTGWLIPALAVALALAWTIAFLIVEAGDLFGTDPRQSVALVATWAGPMLLIGVGWLLARGSSHREATRFTRAAGILGSEAARLEARLITVNRELSLAREFISAQSRDLESLGRVAVDRLGESGNRLQALVQTNGAQVDAIAGVSRTALENMEQLRDHLPVLASSTKDVTNYIGSAGRAAQEHVKELQIALHHLGDSGVANEQQVRSLRTAVESAMGEFSAQCDQLGAIAEARFAVLGDRSAAFRSQLEQHETETLSAVRSRAAALAEELQRLGGQIETDEGVRFEALKQRAVALREESERLASSLRTTEGEALGKWREAAARIEADVGGALVLIDNADRDAFDASRKRLVALSEDVDHLDSVLREREQALAAQVANRRATAAGEEQQALAALDQRLDTLDAAIAARHAAQERHAMAIAEHGETIAARFAQCEDRLSEIAAHGGQVGARLTGELQALTDGLGDSRAALAAANGEVVALGEAGATLIELLRATSAHSRDDLPAAMQESIDRFAALAQENARLLNTLAEARQQGESLAGLLQHSGTGLLANFSEIAALQTGANDKAGEHAAQLDGLKEALASIEEGNDRLLAKARGEFAETLTALTQQLAEASATALERALRAGVAETAGRLEQAASHAVGVSSEAGLQLRTEIARVDELASGIEARVADARHRAETQVDHDFARRASQITESLNTHAIDISKALEADLPDTAWAAFLKGDRGIFTRRAVRLLDSGQTRTIASLYQNDAAFQEHVSRYIADFETMLRDLLAAREGNVFAVTLLSSDLGKLYVALAQAIERLRS